MRRSDSELFASDTCWRWSRNDNSALTVLRHPVSDICFPTSSPVTPRLVRRETELANGCRTPVIGVRVTRFCRRYCFAETCRSALMNAVMAATSTGLNSSLGIVFIAPGVLALDGSSSSLARYSA